jgi:hypothetical protein
MFRELMFSLESWTILLELRNAFCIVHFSSTLIFATVYMSFIEFFIHYCYWKPRLYCNLL